MAISVEDVKLMASQRLADTDDGGGQMTGNEVVDGNVNNLFPDISRLDRVYGRVSLRKAFVHINTADNDTYNGAHAILSVPAADPNVGVCLFTTDNPHDVRTNAIDRLESYVTRGPRYHGWLWGPQLAGARQLVAFQSRGMPVPGIGDVLFLIQDEGIASEQSQYVRVTKVEYEDREFVDSKGNKFQRTIVNMNIGDPLRYTFDGIEVTASDQQPTSLYTTIVADAAKYYGVTTLKTPVAANDITLNVESIYTHLVPSAQGEAPVVDVSPGEAGPVMGTGQPYTVLTTSKAWSNGEQLHFCRGIKYGSLTVTGGGHTYTENGDGILMEGISERGTVDYSTGTVTFTNISAFTAGLTATAIIGAELPRVPNSRYIEVTLGNRGYNYTTILDPPPVRRTLLVDFMAQGKWYRLRDNGVGYLVPDIADTGTGTINYDTGSISVTCGAIPDVETAIMFFWGVPVESEDISGLVTIPVAQVQHTVANPPIKPGSLAITWPSGEGTATATDNGSGSLSGDATGSVNYVDGKVYWKPTSIPATGSSYTLSYNHYSATRLTGNVSGSSGLVMQGTIPGAPLKAGTVELATTVTIGGVQRALVFHDNGGGGLSAGGFTVDQPIGHDDWPGTTVVGGVSGTIDYATGGFQIVLAGAAGSVTYEEPYEQKVLSFQVTNESFSIKNSSNMTTSGVYN